MYVFVADGERWSFMQVFTIERVCVTTVLQYNYRIYSRISREILDSFGPIFFQFDLYAGQYLVLNSTQVNTKKMFFKVHFDSYAGRLISKNFRYSLILSDKIKHQKNTCIELLL